MCIWNVEQHSAFRAYTALRRIVKPEKGTGRDECDWKLAMSTVHFHFHIIIVQFSMDSNIKQFLIIILYNKNMH